MITVIGQLGGWLATLLATTTGQWIFAAILIGGALLQGFFQVFTRFAAFMVERLLIMFLFFAEQIVELLPAAPDAPPANLQPLADALGVANRYLPITEAFTAVAMAGGVFVTLWAYKIAKLIRGGG